MEVMAIVRRRTETYSEQQIATMLEPEAETIRRLYIEGVVRAIWSRNDALGAVVLFEADSLDAAREIVAAFPLVKSDMAEVQMLIPMRGYRGFAPRSG
jgi:muconolactone delta-isomerase